MYISPFHQSRGHMRACRLGVNTMSSSTTASGEHLWSIVIDLQRVLSYVQCYTIF